jgi:hypothetical protein
MAEPAGRGFPPPPTRPLPRPSSGVKAPPMGPPTKTGRTPPEVLFVVTKTPNEIQGWFEDNAFVPEPEQAPPATSVSSKTAAPSPAPPASPLVSLLFLIYFLMHLRLKTEVPRAYQ